jgi:hypothetical protein
MTSFKKLHNGKNPILKAALISKQKSLQWNYRRKATVFTADAVSMYTNIHTRTALHVITSYLIKNEDWISELLPGLPILALTEALRLIMSNNIFRFGDTPWLQLSGTAMGTPPAPPYATLFYAIHEEAILTEFSDNLLVYRRFIDDIFGVWLDTPGDNLQFQLFTKRLNDFGLIWEVSTQSHQVDFMDLTITISANRIVTYLYEKAMKLYLYIPPQSAQPPGVLSGLIYGNVNRIQRLCLEEHDRLRLTKEFYQRLLVRGYKSS